jgi:hypothetical protein
MTKPMLRLTTTDQELAANKDYQTVMEQITLLYNSGVVARGGGFCLSMSEMIRTLLHQQGIACHLVECKLTVMSKNPPRLSLVGHDNLTVQTASHNFNQLDVHVVCITDTAIPMLIDLSIAEIRPEHTPYICERLNETEDHIAEYQWADTTWVYQHKAVSQLPKMHQESIAHRFLTDRKIFKTLRILAIMLAISLTISTLNAVRGGWDYYQVYIKDDNSWGPDQLRTLMNKIEQIEQRLNKLPL